MPIIRLEMLIHAPPERCFDTHVFVPQPEGTLMLDVFFFRAPLGVLGRVAETLFLTHYMKGLLLSRNRYLKQVAESMTEPSSLLGT